MNKKKLLKLLERKEARKAELLKLGEQTQDVTELRAYNQELTTINEEIVTLRAVCEDETPTEQQTQTQTQTDERTAAVNGEIPGIVVSSHNSQAEEKRNVESKKLSDEIDKIATSLRSGKEVEISPEMQKAIFERSVSTSTIVLENKYSQKIAENFNEVPQTIDLVDTVPLNGGNSYTVAIAISDGEADYTGEGETYTNDEGTFTKDETGRAKITNSAIVDEEVLELPNADYLSRVISSVRKSIRKKISKQIINGAGTSNTIKGIYNNTIAIPSNYKVEAATIDADTLRKIVFAYGGDEDIEAPATLFLNKLDLAAFAAVKAQDGRSYYKIEYNGANGFIEEAIGGLRVPYTINSACNVLSDNTTADNTKTMVYGDPKAYELPLFSPLTIKRTDERYIDKGQIGFFGKTIAGGVINKYKGFICVSKKA